MSTIAMYRRRITRSLEGCRFKPSLRLCLFEEGYSFDLFGFLIALPFLDRYAYDPHEIMESWGVYLNGVESQWKWDSIVWCWGDHCKFFHMPWEFVHIKHEVLRPDRTWTPYVGSWEEGPSRAVNEHGTTFGGKEPDGRAIWTLPYRYVLKSGEVQDVIATVHVERSEWRRRWTKRIPWFAKVRKSIGIQFSDEVGAARGSWKGGCIGCGWDLRNDETVEQSLRRMEAERTFR